MNMGDAMMNRPIIARRETVLSHRQRCAAYEQHGGNRHYFQRGHHRPPQCLRLTHPKVRMKTDRKM
jgi:hypothetical protein